AGAGSCRSRSTSVPPAGAAAVPGVPGAGPGDRSWSTGRVKRPVVLAAALAAAAVLAGCGTPAPSTSAQAPAPASAAPSSAPVAASIAPPVVAPVGPPAPGVPALTGDPTDLKAPVQAGAGTAPPPGGLLAQDLVVGSGPAATASDTVDVRYSGTL